MGQGGLKVFTYDITHRQPAPPKQKIFFRVQSTRLATFFDIFAGSLERTGAEIFIRKATFESAAFCEPLELTRLSKC